MSRQVLNTGGSRNREQEFGLLLHRFLDGKTVAAPFRVLLGRHGREWTMVFRCSPIETSTRRKDVLARQNDILSDSPVNGPTPASVGVLLLAISDIRNWNLALTKFHK
jgi:hypothetical protein